VHTLLSPSVRAEGRSLFTAEEHAAVSAFFGERPQLSSTPLHRLRGLARRLDLRELLVKDESARFGLTAFKVVGVTYAVERLAQRGLLRPGGIVACATTGNHGRAVARAARLRGLEARIYVPAGTDRSRIAAIESEGARVAIVPGSYDDAVREVAAAAAAAGWTLVSDTSWSGYHDVPRWIMAGYTWIFEEASRQWPPDLRPDVVIVQAGVGGLAAAAASWIAFRYAAARPTLVVCEPVNAACLMASAAAGRPTRIEGTLETAMAGLRCGEISEAAWPAIRDGIDGFVTVTDTETFDAMHALLHPAGSDTSIVAGPSGACGVAALTTLRRDPTLAAFCETVGIRPGACVLAVVTEGLSVQSGAGPPGRPAVC
jgi:diaminopropionate ammonia-lyase